MKTTVYAIGVAVVALLMSSCGGGGGGGGGSPAPAPTWLVMVYIAADNNLEVQVADDVNLMEFAPASTQVKTVVQVDTMTVPFNGSTSAKRVLIQHNNDFGTVTSPTVMDLGEINTASPGSVQDFVVWAKATYPSNRYVLVLWDHGGQWGGWGQDETSGAGALTYPELKTMFAGIQAASGIAQFDIIGFDACLMAAVEVDQMLAPYAAFRVGSCEVEMGGWDYDVALSALVANPSMSPAAFGKEICDAFIDLKNIQGATNQTQSVARLANAAGLVTAVNAFSTQLSANLVAELTPCIAPSRRMTAEYGKQTQDEPGFFVDLRQFAALVESSTVVPALSTAAANVLAAVDAEITYRAQGAKAPDHRGISIYFPNCPCDPSQPDYPNVDLAAATQWDEFIVAYQNALGGDVTAPGVLITGVSSANVSGAAPVTVDFTLTGADIISVSAMISSEIAADQWLIFGEIEFGPLDAGAYNTTWDAAVFAIGDGVDASYLPAWSLQANTSLYLGVMQLDPVSGPAQTVLVVLDLDWAAGTGSILGFFEVTSSGTLGARQVNEGDELTVQFPVWDANAGTLSYELGVASLVVPPGGAENLTIFKAQVPDGSIDFDIFAEDFAENIGVDSVTLTVP